MIVGEVYLSFDELDPKYKSNRSTILNRLTESDVFDKNLEFKNKDVLEIVLNNYSEKDRKIFCFQYIKGIWKNKRYNPFELESEYDEKDIGKLKNPIKR
jgi:hypothetical protein